MEANILSSGEFQILRLPRISKVKRPGTNYFREKERDSSLQGKQGIGRGKSRDNVRGQRDGFYNLPPANVEKPCTKPCTKWSKRIFFSKRTEMAMKNLVLFIFDGVLGDCFKKNLWGGSPIKMYFRRGVIKELKRLKEDFQIVLFFLSDEIKPRKVLKYLESKSLTFDAVYKSSNTLRCQKKKFNILQKKPLKFSEFLQDYTQTYLDFGLQHEIQDRVLIITSISLTVEDFDRRGEELLYHKSSQNLINYLCKGMPAPTVWSELPIVLAIPDPRLHHNFAGVSFTNVSGTIYSLAQYEDEWSWQDKYNESKLEAIATTFITSIMLSNANAKSTKSSFPEANLIHRFLVLKQTSLTNYAFIQDHAYSIKPLFLKNLQ